MRRSAFRERGRRNGFMKLHMRHALHGSALRFTLPVIAENVLTAAVGLIYSAVLGGVSASSLAAAGTGNQAMSFIVSFFSAVTTGSAILASRLTGQGDRNRLSRVVEHAMLLAPALSVMVMAFLIIISVPFTRVLMPGASDAFFGEGLSYFRCVLVSLPGLITYNVLSGILRASGDSKSALISTLLMNAVQLLAAFLFINVLHMEITGAGLAYVVCRYAGALALLIAIFRHHRSFSVDPRRIVRPSLSENMRILKTGLPSTVDAMAVQGGYLIINTLLIGLGQMEASVYNVLNTLIGMTGICQGIVNASATTLVGHKVGAGDIAGARKTENKILFISVSATVLLCAVVMVFPAFFTGLFTGDDTIQGLSADLIWVNLMFCIPAVVVNSVEPCARVGGEAKLVMLSCILNVWCLRLPLTWLFCYPMDMGVTGVFLANSIACTSRGVFGYLMTHKKRWGTRPV